MPLSLDGLVGHLVNAALPASEDKLHRLRQIQHRPHLSAGQVATLASSDPGLSMAILRAVHMPVAAAQRGSKRPTSLGHAVLLLGVDTSVATLLNCPDASGLAKGARAGYYRAAARVTFAAHCARAWGRSIADPAPDELHLAAYCHYFTELALWVAKPDNAGALEVGRRQDKGGTDSCEPAILGASLAKCTEILGPEWGLPELACDVPEPATADEIRSQMRDPQARRKLTVRIAIELGQTGNLGWRHPRSKRAVACSQALLRRPVDRISQELHSHAAACAREHPLESAFSPALALVLAPDDVLPQPRQSASAVATAAKPEAGRPPQRAPTLASRSGPRGLQKAKVPDSPAQPLTCTESLKCFLDGSYGVSEFLQGVATGMALELDVDRAIFAIITLDKQHLRARFTSRPEKKRF